MPDYSGEIPKNYLILAGGVIFVVIIAVLVLVVFRKPPPPVVEVEKPKGPVYELVIGNVKFKLKEAKDRGDTLKASESKYAGDWRQKDLTTTERFIEVTITAENMGKEKLPVQFWDIDKLIDGEGRVFDVADQTSPWILGENRCGAVLKPSFTPTPCTRIYEVAKISTGLKVKVGSKLISSEGTHSLEKKYLLIDLGL